MLAGVIDLDKMGELTFKVRHLLPTYSYVEAIGSLL